MPLTGRQADALTAAADGAPLRVVAERLGIPREQAASHLARAYERLDVTYLPRGERRAAAVRAAVHRGLIPTPNGPETT
jgi:DNA-binding NarL/FixJ family response regulator